MSRGLGDVYKRQVKRGDIVAQHDDICLLYTSDAADDLTRVDLGGRRIIKKISVVAVSLKKK
ncbi:hypothetical protein JMUB7535_26830 [Staphylococcus aureus]